MARLLVTRGLPGSGKSTFARRWVAENPTGRYRVNRDDLRAMGHDSTHVKAGKDSPGTERIIVAARNAMVMSLLRRGVDVIVDETCLPDKTLHSLRQFAGRAGATFEVVDFRHVPVEVCIARDAQRTGTARVGEDVIRGMWERHLAERSVAV
ncbi:AAA family ATPase [Micromonospora sp. WMMD1102]|uniref:AAA family ATPase n=1 Tax=Micromonospora sp. WMMD1102 TaxID=3016105 RepID=UPI002414EF7B|nr:AAA family ATPase [Micromonospora sp. WMMD1102]MDG4792114.1 AAA family ATPase [Micromonospora sp. WMMD1102]